MQQHANCNVLAVEIHAGDVNSDIPVITEAGVHTHKMTIQPVQAAQCPSDEFSDATIIKPDIRLGLQAGCLRWCWLDGHRYS
jgi:hypothetical protein